MCSQHVKQSGGSYEETGPVEFRHNRVTYISHVGEAARRQRVDGDVWRTVVDVGDVDCELYVCTEAQSGVLASCESVTCHDDN